MENPKEQTLEASQIVGICLLSGFFFMVFIEQITYLIQKLKDTPKVEATLEIKDDSRRADAIHKGVPSGAVTTLLGVGFHCISDAFAFGASGSGSLLH